MCEEMNNCCCDAIEGDYWFSIDPRREHLKVFDDENDAEEFGLGLFVPRMITGYEEIVNKTSSFDDIINRINKNIDHWNGEHKKALDELRHQVYDVFPVNYSKVLQYGRRAVQIEESIADLLADLRVLYYLSADDLDELDDRTKINEILNVVQTSNRLAATNKNDTLLIQYICENMPEQTIWNKDFVNALKTIDHYQIVCYTDKK